MALNLAVNILAGFAIFAALPKNSIGTPQTITFFSNPGCPTAAQNQTFADTNDQLKGSWVETARSALIVGLWKINAGSTKVFYSTQPPQGRCVNRTDWGGNPEWVERLGPSEITSSQIIFFTEELYNGLSYKVEEEQLEELPLPDNPRPLAMRSFIQFGKDSWTTYPEKAFNGTGLRFEASKTAQDPSDSFTYNDSIMVIVGSVKKDKVDVESNSSKASADMMAIITILAVACSTFL